MSSDQHELDYGRTTARFYDAACEEVRSAEDVAFFRKLASETGGPVLELGCGTGRALLPIAADGIPCTGIDLSPAMLNVMRTKDIPPTLRLVVAPMQDFDLGDDRFALIFSAFRAFQHLDTVEDQLACLRCVRAHLAPGGCFAFDVFNPRLDRTAILEEPEKEDARFQHGGAEIVRFTSVERDTSRQVMTVRMRYAEYRNGEHQVDHRSKFAMRWFYRYELEHLLSRAGFEHLDLYGDFDGSPFAEGSPSLVVVARLRASR